MYRTNEMKAWEKDDTFLARWMSGDLNEEELRSFEASEEFADFRSITSSLDDFESPAFDQDAVLKKVKWQIDNTKENKGRLISLKRTVVFAAAASIVVLLSVGIFLELTNAPIVELSASVKDQVDLPDGSTIAVNQGSSIAYSEGWWSGKRSVELTGEAFFNVTKGEEFQVHAGKGTVTVLGTSFNVLENQGLLVVGCYTGKVKVEAYGKEIILTPGKEYRIGSDRVGDTLFTVGTSPSWMVDLIELNNTSLSDAIIKLKNQYNLKVNGDFEDVENLNISFPAYDLEIALGQVFGPVGIKYTYDKEKNTVTIE